MIEPEHMTIIRTVARRMVFDPWDADDAAQEAALKVWRMLQRVPDAGDGAVAQAARWGVLKWMESRYRMKNTQLMLLGTATWDDIAETSDLLCCDPWPAVESRAVVRQALESVPDPVQRTWVFAICVLGLSETEARAATGLAPSTRRRRLPSTRAAMAAAMGRS